MNNSKKLEEIKKLIKKETAKQLNETRLVTFAGQIASDIKKNVPGIQKQLGLSYIVDGITGLYRYEDGNAYEITIKPVKFAQYKDIWKKLITKKKTEPEEKVGFSTKDLASGDVSLNEDLN